MTTSHRSRGAAFARRLGLFLSLGALLVALTGGTAAADLAAVSPGVDPATGFPLYMEDTSGLRLQLCVGAGCGPAAVLPNPGAAASVPGNFPTAGEAPYFSATANLNGPSSKIVWVASVTAAFAPSFAAGNQITFNRVRVTGTGLTPGATYTITDPYGTEDMVADSTGKARVTVGGAGAAGIFTTALTGPVGPFLRSSGAAPAGFIGDGVTPAPVTGGPLGNAVTITGTDVGGAGVNTLTTSDLIVAGKIASGAPSGLALAAASDTGASHTDGITSNTTPTITGVTPIAGATINLSVDGAAAASGTAAGNTFSIPLTAALANGQHTITAVAIDPATATASPASAALTITIDTIAPAAPSVPATGGTVTAGSGATFAGTAEAGSTVSILSDLSPIGSGVAAGGSYSIASSALTVGLHHVTATATDVAGNASPASAALALTVAKPVLPALPAPASPQLSSSSDSGTSNSDNITNVTKPTFNGTLPFADGTVTLYSDGAVVGRGNAAGGTYAIASNRLGNGSHLITIVATDNATGRDTLPSFPLKITIDSAAPSAPSTPASSLGTKLLPSTIPTFSGSAESGATVIVYADGVRIGSGVAFGGSYLVSAAGPLAAGSHSITATATDIAGNVSSASGALSISVGDPTPPAPAPKLTSKLGAGKVAAAKVKRGSVVVTTTISVDQAGLLDLSVLDAKGNAIALLAGSRFGSAAIGDGHTTSFRVSLTGPGQVTLTLVLPKKSVKAKLVYSISLQATNASGATGSLSVGFRLAPAKPVAKKTAAKPVAHKKK